jgi:hypothetical protein
MRTSDRWLAAGAIMLLAACHDRGAQDPGAQALAQAEQRRATEDDGRILCARLDGPLRPTCTVEQTPGARGLMLTVRHDDGGFHRLLVTGDGRGVVAADGAEPARVTVPNGQSIDVALGEDRYRLPATIKDRP